MKILTVIQADGDNLQKKIPQTQRRLLFFCNRIVADIDTCIYGSKESLALLDLNALSGNIYLQEAEGKAAPAIAASLHSLVMQAGYESVIFEHDAMASDVAVLLAGLCNFSFVTKAVSIEAGNSQVFCSKLVYSNNLLAQYELSLPFVISAQLPDNHELKLDLPSGRRITLPICKNPSYILEQTIVSSAQRHRPSPVLLAAGMGVSEKQGIARIRDFAKENGFDFGVSRPVAMRGWAEIDEIIGASGSIFSPKLTITLGVSGAAAFFVGIEKSEYILSVNIDSEATIAKQSDAVIVDSCENVLENLFDILRQYKISRF